MPKHRTAVEQLLQLKEDCVNIFTRYTFLPTASRLLVEGALTPEVDRGVVHEVPAEHAQPVVLALVDLGGLDQLLLVGRHPAPQHHVAALGHVRGRDHEAGVVRAQRGGEHARAPRPPGVRLLLGQALQAATGLVLVVVHDLDALDGVDGLLLGRVGDLRDGRHALALLPVGEAADAAWKVVIQKKFFLFELGAGGQTKKEKP